MMLLSRTNNGDLKELIDTASAWCAAHGVLMGSRRPAVSSEQDNSYNLYEPAPFALEPSPFPKAAFDKCYELGKPWNNIVHAIAQSYETWLRPTLLAAASSDQEFTGKLLSLADEVVSQRKNHNQQAQRVTLGILRSDYLLQNPQSMSTSTSTTESAYPLQVELNTIASSFGCLSTKVSQLHQFLYHDQLTLQNQYQLIDNPAAVSIVDGLAAAFHEYVQQRSRSLEELGTSADDSTSSYQPVILMIVQPHEANACDQRALEFLLFQHHGIRLLRRSLLDVTTHAKNSPAFQNKELIVPLLQDDESNHNWFAAAVVYYRAGYTPTDYPSDKEWEGRAMIEHSAAIKCPDVFLSSGRN
jgi:glutathione synthase